MAYAEGRTYHDHPIVINDQLVVISTADIFSIVQKRVAKEVVQQAQGAVVAGVETLKDFGENLMERVRAS